MLYEQVLEMGNVTFTETDTVSHQEWLDLRTTGVGGSDAGALMGMNKYSTPLSVYLSKKDLASFGGNLACEWGNLLEDPVRQKAKEELDIQIETVPGMFTNKKNTFMNANFDGLVYIDGEKEIAGVKVSGLGGHEIKTSRSGIGFGQDEIPDSYYCQVQHYMAVTGIKFFILTVFIIDQYAGRHYVINRNDEFIESMIATEKTFWNDFVMKDIAPSPTGNENEFELVKSLSFDEAIELPIEYANILEQKKIIGDKIKELTKKSDMLKEVLLLKMTELSAEDSDKTKATCGGWKISFNKQSRTNVDSSKLKKDGLYDKYSKKSENRVMRISGKSI